MASPLIPQDLYNQIITHVPIACVDIAVVSNGSVLLVKRKDAPARGQWWTPGGRVHKGEKMKATARRKALEEIGIDCHVGPIIHTAETIFPDGPHGIAVHSIKSCFLLHPVETQGQLPLRDDARKDFHQEALIPAAEAAFHGDAVVAGMLLQER